MHSKNGNQFGISSGRMLCENHATVTGIEVYNTRATQASNHRALGDIGNPVGAMSVYCNVSKDSMLE